MVKRGAVLALSDLQLEIAEALLCRLSSGSHGNEKTNSHPSQVLETVGVLGISFQVPHHLETLGQLSHVDGVVLNVEPRAAHVEGLVGVRRKFLQGFEAKLVRDSLWEEG